MEDAAYAAIETALARGGAEAAVEELLQRLRALGRHHDLFDALLMQARRRLAVDIATPGPLQDLPEPQRSQMEEASIVACREVGRMLLDAGKFREAWMYLRPAEEKGLLAERLAQVEPNDDNVAELIELALYEGVAPALGFELVLRHHGVCNAISTYEGMFHSRPLTEQQAAAGLLVRRLHQDLIANVCADIARQEGHEPAETTLAQLAADRDWLLAGINYHVDTTHLASIVRCARILEDPSDLRLALDLTEYGRRLSQQFQYAGEEPFVDMYPAHGLFFAALLGERRDEATAHFRERAVTVDIAQHGAAAVETYVLLLTRMGQISEAARAAAKLLPPGVRTSGATPSLFELSRRAGDFAPLLEVSRERDDLVGFTAGLIEQSARRR